MAINTIEAAKIFQTALDQQVLEGATSGWMEENAGQVKYSGGNEVKIPKISLSGLGDYDRDSGYTQGAVTFSYETKTMTMDRGRKFLLDKMDDFQAPPIGTRGTVRGVDDAGNLLVRWDNGSGLNAVLGVDVVQKIRG